MIRDNPARVLLNFGRLDKLERRKIDSILAVP